MNKIICKVTQSTQVLIKAKGDNIDLNQPLYAVNWFSTKRAWMYNLYNFLASKSLKKIGGKAFFKGEIMRTILDENNSIRDLILIVRYPNGSSFKMLLENTYFKIISVFRLFSVKDFTFGFTHQLIESRSNLRDKLFYVVHHFKTTDSSIYQKFEDLLSSGVQVKYAGKMAAGLYSQQENKKEKEIPCIMDGVLLFEAKSEAVILDWINQKEYQAIINTLESSFIGTVKRTL